MTRFGMTLARHPGKLLQAIRLRARCPLPDGVLAGIGASPGRSRCAAANGRGLSAAITSRAASA